MEISVGDVFSYIKNPKDNLKALAIIRQTCRARPKGYQYMPSYRKGMWDGYISLMYQFNSFPTGLLDIVTNSLRKRGIFDINLHWQPLNGHAEVTEDFLHGITLRPYQIEAANMALNATRGIAKMATNAGKTEVMAAITKSLDIRTLIVLHRKELLYQTVDRLKERLQQEIGIIGDGHHSLKFVTVAMVQTLVRDVERFDFSKNGALFADECHTSSSDQMMDVLYKIPGAYRYGFSGTPLKHDLLSDMKLISITGKVLFEISNETLINLGYSAQPVIYIHTLVEDNKDLWELDYQEAYDQLIVHYKPRNARIASLACGHNGVVLVIVSRIEHGHILRDMIPGSVFVHGGDTTEYRQGVLSQMRNGNGVFIASPIFDEGIDVPSIDCLIMVCGGKSDIRLLQRLGRGMRKKPGDNRLTVIDFIDDTNQHLLSHSESRIDTYAREGFDTRLVGSSSDSKVLQESLPGGIW